MAAAEEELVARSGIREHIADFTWQRLSGIASLAVYRGGGDGMLVELTMTVAGAPGMAAILRLHDARGGLPEVPACLGIGELFVESLEGDQLEGLAYHVYDESGPLSLYCRSVDLSCAPRAPRLTLPDGRTLVICRGDRDPGDVAPGGSFVALVLASTADDAARAAAIAMPLVALGCVELTAVGPHAAAVEDAIDEVLEDAGELSVSTSADADLDEGCFHAVFAASAGELPVVAFVAHAPEALAALHRCLEPESPTSTRRGRG